MALIPHSSTIRNERGQVVTEYILLLSVVVLAFLAASQAISRFGLAKRLSDSFSGDFAHAYQFGHPKAKGFDDQGGPENHPRIVSGSNNFRIFLTPDGKK